MFDVNNKMTVSMIWYDRLNRFDFSDDIVDNIVNVHSVHNHIRRHFYIDL